MSPLKWIKRVGVFGSKCVPFAILLVSQVAARGQNVEATSLIGATLGGTIHLEQSGAPNFYAHLADGFSFGVAGGYRFEADDGGHDMVGFRWYRENSHLSLAQNPLVVAPYTASYFRPSITVDRFLGDFLHEFPIEDTPSIEPYVIGSVGAALLSVPASRATRFAFGIGAGVKVFPTVHWGFQVSFEYQPIVMHAELQNLICTAGCIVILNGGVMNQFQLSIGPSFRFWH